MKRLFVYSLYPPYVGGAASTAELLLRHPPSDGPTWLLTQRAPGRPLIERLGALHVLRLLPARDGLRRSRRLRPFLWLGTQIILCAVILGLRPRGVRLVQLHGRFVNFWTASFLALLRPLGLRTLVDQRDRFTRPARLRRFDQVVVNSLGLYERHAPALRDPWRIRLIPSPIDLQNMRQWRETTLAGANAPAMDPDLVLFVGELSRAKGLDLLLDAAALARVSRPGLRVVALGPATAASDPALLERLARECVFHGPVEREMVWRWMLKAGRVALPSRSEGLPRSILEAIALERPVIAPPGLAEFDRFLPQCVLSSLHPADLARLLLAPAEEARARDYPLDRHDPALIAASFHELHKRLLQTP